MQKENLRWSKECHSDTAFSIQEAIMTTMMTLISLFTVNTAGICKVGDGDLITFPPSG